MTRQWIHLVGLCIFINAFALVCCGGTCICPLLSVFSSASFSGRDCYPHTLAIAIFSLADLSTLALGALPGPQHLSSAPLLPQLSGPGAPGLPTSLPAAHPILTPKVCQSALLVPVSSLSLAYPSQASLSLSQMATTPIPAKLVSRILNKSRCMTCWATILLTQHFDSWNSPFPSLCLAGVTAYLIPCECEPNEPEMPSKIYPIPADLI